jgi:phasin
MADAPFQIPNEMRDFAERSVEQARKAFEGFVTVAQKTAGEVEGAVSNAQTSARSAGQQVLGYAEQNVNAAFDLAQKLVKAKDPQEAFALQSAFVQKQFEALKAQAETLASQLKPTAKK